MPPRPRAADVEPLPESDRIGELPHPRERLELFGHAAAARALAEAARSGRMHHAWIVAGPKGVGKATLAWRLARALLAHGPENCPDDLSVPAGHPVLRQIAALAHQDLILIRRPWDVDKKRFKTELPIDEVRRLPAFFSRHASQGGYRVAVVDLADEMSIQAQNALLKTLEEPPPRGLLLLVSNTPGALLPTTRSRCRLLTLRPLDADAMADAVNALAPGIAAKERDLISALADGAPGRALALAETDAIPFYREIVELLQGLPRLNAVKLFALADKVSRPASDRLAMFVALLSQIEERVLRGAYTPVTPIPGEADLLRHLRTVIPLEAWSRLWEDLKTQAAQVDELNLDKKQLILNTFFALEAAAER